MAAGFRPNSIGLLKSSDEVGQFILGIPAAAKICNGPCARREIGWRAYGEGGLEFMHRVSDLAQDQGANGALIDHWWDNIGGSLGIWWC